MDYNTVLYYLFILCAIYGLYRVLWSIGEFVVSALQKQPIAVEAKIKPAKKRRNKRG